MPLPLIPIVVGAASLAAGALGLKKGYEAKKTFDEARQIAERAQRRYDSHIKELDSKRKSVNNALESLGEYKKKVFVETLTYVVQQVKNARSSAEGFDEQISSIDIKEVDLFERELTEISALDLSSGAARGLAAGAAGAFGAYGTVGLVASASTGTAISSLAGAAATKATLAWLGGGSLATGGLGIVGGTWILGGLVAGPALAITGYTLASKAEEALTSAEEYKAEVNKAIAELKTPFLLLDEIQSNIDEVRYVLSELAARFSDAKLDHEKNLKIEGGWQTAQVATSESNHQDEINQRREKRICNLIAFGKSIKAVVCEPLLDVNGAATKGFRTRITGIVKVESIDGMMKPCTSCGNQISTILRICPECNNPQDAQAESS